MSQTTKRAAIYGGAGAKFGGLIEPAGRAGALATGLVGLLLALGAAQPPAPTAAPPPPDLAAFYRPAANRLALTTRREGDSLRLFLNYPAPAPGAAAPTWQLTAWPDYEARPPRWQRALAPRPYPGSDPAAPVQVLTAAVAAADVPAGTVLEMSVVQATATNQPAPPASENPSKPSPGTTAWLRLTPEQLARPFVLLDSAGLVLARPWLRAGEAVAIVSFGLSQPVRWRRYAAGVPALPPFADPRRAGGGPRTLAVLDSSAAPAAAGALLRLRQPGLYALRVGGAAGEPARTVPLLVEASPSFPDPRSAPELIEPLLYLSTAAERQRLRQAPDPKRALDGFWLRAAGDDQDRARGLIRRYYAQAAAANELFTGHKAGWLTDRGLIYIVFGPPPSVRRLPTGEERWRYDTGGRQGEALSFTFRPRPTTLAPDNYELVRRPEYEPLWYAAVAQWRTTTNAR